MVRLLRKRVSPALLPYHLTTGLRPSQDVTVTGCLEGMMIEAFTSFTASAKFGTLVSLVTGSSVPG